MVCGACHTKEAVKKEQTFDLENILSCQLKIKQRPPEDQHSKPHGKAMASLSEMSLEDIANYRKTLESLIRGQEKTQELEAQAREMGTSVSLLKKEVMWPLTGQAQWDGGGFMTDRTTEHALNALIFALRSARQSVARANEMVEKTIESIHDPQQRRAIEDEVKREVIGNLGFLDEVEKLTHKR